MRMRHKPNLQPRLERCAEYIISEPEQEKGSWKQHYAAERLFLEIGCGKGRFTVHTAETLSGTLLVAVEMVADAMVTAVERVKEKELTNVRFINKDAKLLPEIFAAGELDRIYINFCDPWPKSRDAKFRLTSPGFLRTYADALPTGGEIHFKTDNVPLFDWSVEQLSDEGWELRELTHDLHENGPTGVMTDYEVKFYATGLKINRVVAVKTESTKGTAAGPVARLRNASLVDARGYEASKAAQEGNV